MPTLRLPSLLCLLQSVLLLLALSEAATALGKAPFQSIKAPAETIRDYEIHIPIISKLSNQDYPRRMVVEISQFKLHMELNQGLIHPKFTSHHFDEDGQNIVKKGHVNCFYQGRVEGHPKWWVSMTTCHGLQGSFGEPWNRENFFHFEPLDGANPALEQAHALYSDDQYSERTGTCGTKSGRKLENTKHSPILSGFPPNKLRLQRRQVNQFDFVEWVLINDMAQYDAFNQNLTAVVLRGLAIANFVDMVYQTLSVRVVVVDVITWSNGNQISYPGDNNATIILNNLKEFATTITVEHDSTMLITGINLPGNSVGLAPVGTMCDNRLSVGLSQDGGVSLEQVGSTAAHELGHIFGMKHDEGRQCTCTDPTNTCLMAAVSSSPSPTQWSSCSRSDIANGFNDDNLDRCLKNEPLVTVADPVCGNGIRERDEICDCGSIEECTDPCCNATTCTLRRGAACYQGPCCSSDCQFFTPGTTCRSASQECDLIEYCTGDSSNCPRDVYKQDVTACSQGQRFCFNGTCRSLDSQCQRFFRSQNSVPECYARSNILGTESGNCGTRNGQFVACDPEHAQCGQVMCDGGDFQSKEVSVSVTITTRTIIVGSSLVTCKTFSNSPPTSDNPGLVPDGVKCGNQSLCVSQTCTAISALDYVQPCPLGRNGQTCADAGLCNNLNQCSCNVGLTGDSCEQLTGTPGRTPGGRAGVVAGAVIGALLALSLAISVAVVVAVFLKSRKRKSTLPAVQGKGVTKQTAKSRTESNNYSLCDSINNTTTVNVIRPSAPPRGGYIPPPTGRSSRPAPPPAKVAPTTRSAPPPRPSKIVPPSPLNPPLRPVKPPSAAQKPSKFQQQWPPPNSAPSAAPRKPLPPQKKPMAAARRQF